MLKIENFIREAELCLADFNRDSFLRVYHYVESLYKDMTRLSGEDELTHALKVATLLLPLKIDQNTLMATMLLNAHKSEKYDLEEIRALFGSNISKLVKGLEKLNLINSRYSNSNASVLRKMVLTIAEDLRVILIRLAERIENMSTLHYLDALKQKAIARETLDVYVPIAARLSLYEFKYKLEDLAFKFLFPAEYQNLSKEMIEYTSQYEKNIEETTLELENLMKAHNFNVTISGRLKNLFSIYNKLKKKNLSSVYELHDIYAMRIVLLDQEIKGVKTEKIDDLYAILSLLHSKYQPDLKRFKDYVAYPKQNHYQSLHTTIIGISSSDPSRPVEVQIRTERMHRFAESGLAVHWLYKDKNDFNIKNFLHKDLKSIQTLNQLKQELVNPGIKQPSLKIDLYKDHIFVLTPNSKVKDLPKGSTPVDFAYSIHTDVGHAAYIAKVNGTVVPLDYELKSGEVVEIITNNKPNPKLSWLGFVKTRLARNRIKTFFKALDRKTLFEEGRDEFNAFLEKAGLSHLDEDLTLLRVYHGKRISLEDRKTILENIGAGSETPSNVFKNIQSELSESNLYPLNNRKSSQGLNILPNKEFAVDDKIKNKLIIGGQKNMPFRLSECCKPNPEHQIVAYLTKSKGLSIHLNTCKFIRNIDKARFLEAHWENVLTEENKFNYNVGLLLEIKQRKGYLTDIVKLSNSNAVKILEFSLVKKENGVVVRRMVIDVLNQPQLEGIISQLMMINGVLKINRL